MKKFVKKILLLPSNILNRFQFAIHRAQVGRNVTIQGLVRLNGKGKLRIGDGVRINSCRRYNPIGGNTFTSIYIKEHAKVEIGDFSGVSNIAIYSAEEVVIGKYVKVGGNVSIYDTDFHSVDYEERRQAVDPGVKTGKVVIDDDAFIGAHSIVLKGVTVGKRSVVAAGSVVTKDIPPDELWGGVPARFIRKLSGG